MRFVCIRLGGGGGWGGVGWGGVQLGISGFRLWSHDLGFYKKTGNQKKNFNTRNSDLGFRDFPSQPISGQTEKGYGMLS